MSSERWEQVERLYHSALELAPERREFYLVEACKGDSELRREVESLLAQSNSNAGALDRPALDFAADLLSHPARAQLVPGKQFGAYSIEELLGEGGMGVVYRAADTRLRRPVAIKFLSQEFATRAAQRRFQREAQMASSLNHPHILTVLDVGESGGRQYLVTEFIDGGTLKDWALREKPGWQQVVDLLTGVADGLAAAHAAGILHRDIKPANIFVAKNGYAKLGDFGLAKLDEAIPADGDATEVVTAAGTQPGMVIGTLAYMSPEQASGKPLDARSDICSFGIVLYELLSGKRPFDGATGLETLQKIIHQAADPLPETIPAALRMLVEKAIEKDPADRYQSMREMVIDLRRLARQSGTQGQGIATTALPLRKRLWAASAFVFLLAAGAGWWQTRHGVGALSQIRSIAVLPFQNLSRDPDQEFFSDGTTEALISTLGQIHAFQKVISRTSVMRFKGTTKPLPAIGRDLGVDAIVEGSVQREGTRIRITAKLIDVSTDTQLWAGEFDRDLADILSLETEVARNIAEEIKIQLTPAEGILLTSARTIKPAADEQYLPGNHWGSREAVQSLGSKSSSKATARPAVSSASYKRLDPETYEIYLRARYFLARRNTEAMKRALAYFQEVLHRDPEYAPAYAGLAFAYGVMGTYEVLSPENSFPNAKSFASRALQLDNTLAEAYTARAIAASFWEFNWSAAEQDFQRAIALDPSSEVAHHFYAEHLVNIDRADRAVAEMRRARELDPLSLVVNATLGRVYRDARRYEQALEQCGKTVELEPNMQMGHWCLGQVYIGEHRYAAAVHELELANTLGTTPLILRDLAWVYAAVGNKAKANAILDGLMRKVQSEYMSLYSIGVVHAALGEKDEAFRYLNRAFTERDSHITYLALDPELDPLRSDPRFQGLVEQLHIPR